MTPDANREVCNAIIKLRDGSFVPRDLLDAERIPWRQPWPLINANPDRMKICPTCGHYQPIAEFLLESETLRTVVKIDRFEQEIALPCADVAECCKECRK